MKVTFGVGVESIVVGAQLADVEATHGPAEVDEGSATWSALGVFVGLSGKVITSVSGYYTDPNEWIFGGKLTPFAGELEGVGELTEEGIVGGLGDPLKAEDSKPWRVLYYEGISFTFFEGQLCNWAIGEDGDDDDDDDDGEEDW